MIDIPKVNVESNFWTLNPEFKYRDGFKDLYQKDKTRKKKYSSEIVWATYLWKHVKSSFKNMSDEVKEINITEYLKDHSEKHTFKEVEDFTPIFLKQCLTRKQKMYLGWEEKLIERDKFLKITPYTEDNAKDLDAIMKNTKTLWDNYQKVGEEMIEEEAQSQIGGGREESLSEKKVL